MSERKFEHQRVRRKLSEKVSTISLREQLSGQDIQPSGEEGAFGLCGYCPEPIDLDNLNPRYRLRNDNGYKVDISVIERGDRARLLRQFRREGFSNYSAKARLMQIENMVIDQTITAFKAKRDTPYKIGSVIPFATAKLVVDCGKDPEEARIMVEGFLQHSAERYARGEVDEFGRETDEVRQSAFIETRQTIFPGRGTALA